MPLSPYNHERTSTARLVAAIGGSGLGILVTEVIPSSTPISPEVKAFSAIVLIASIVYRAMTHYYSQDSESVTILNIGGDGYDGPGSN